MHALEWGGYDEHEAEDGHYQRSVAGKPHERGSGGLEVGSRGEDLLVQLESGYLHSAEQRAYGTERRRELSSDEMSSRSQASSSPG